MSPVLLVLVAGVREERLEERDDAGGAPATAAG
jgi:hypothetical protein